MNRCLAGFAVVLLLALPGAGRAAVSLNANGPAEVRRVLTLLNVVGEEYREGVVDGRVVQPIEYAEATTFLEEAERRLAAAVSADLGLAPQFASLRGAIVDKVPLAAVRSQVDGLRETISTTTGIAEEVFPPEAPSAVRGRALFQENCISCHGEKADGRGGNAASLDPPPANFTDPQFMRAETPFDFFHIMSVGKPSSAMPAWGDVLSLQERWDLVSFLWTVAPGRDGLAEGQGTYLSQCAGCHGAAGDGKGVFSGSLLTPVPTLATAEALARKSDADLFRAIAQGSPGTAMPAFGKRLGEDEIWRMVSFVRLLSLGGVQAEAPTDASGGPRRFAGLLRLLSEEYARAIPPGGPPNDRELAESRMLLEQVRLRSKEVLPALQAESAGDAGRVREMLQRVGESIDGAKESKPVADLANAAAALVEKHLSEAAPQASPNDGLTAAAQLLDAGLEAYRAGDPRAVYLVSDAYFQFEPVEKELALKAPEITHRVESHFLDLRGVLAKPGGVEQARTIIAAIQTDFDSARQALKPSEGAWAIAVQSAMIILREGFEVVLIVGALLAYVMKSGNAAMRRPILLGALGGVVSSLVSAYVLVALLRATGVAGDLIEGVAMLLATGVLFFVSYWLISKAEADKWQRYIQGKVKVAVARGSGIALAGAAFLAVYREGVETVLFYQALLASAGAYHVVAAGFVVGLALLAVLYVAFMRVGMKIPLRQFFLATSCLLYYLAFVFAGKGVRELQEAGVFGVTPLQGFPSIDLLGIYPTLETLAVQAILLVCLVYAIFVTLRGRRRQEQLGEVAELRSLVAEIREELSHARAAGVVTTPRLETFVERAAEIESQMTLRLAGNGGAKS